MTNNVFLLNSNNLSYEKDLLVMFPQCSQINNSLRLRLSQVTNYGVIHFTNKIIKSIIYS